MKLIWRIVGAGGCHSGRALLAQIRSPGFNFQQLLAFDFPPFVSTSYHRSWLYFQWRQLRCSSICTSSLASWCVSLLQGSTQQSAVMSVNQSEDGTPTNTQAIATVTAAAAVAASSQFRRLKVSLEDVTVRYLLYRSYWGNLASFFLPQVWWESTSGSTCTSHVLCKTPVCDVISSHDKKHHSFVDVGHSLPSAKARGY